jgi:hypothetical protein
VCYYLIDVLLHGLLLSCRQDDLLRAKLDHLVHLLSVDLIWILMLLVVVELALLHNQVVDLELSSRSLYYLLLD